MCLFTSSSVLVFSQLKSSKMYCSTSIFFCFASLAQYTRSLFPMLILFFEFFLVKSIRADEKANSASIDIGALYIFFLPYES